MITPEEIEQIALLAKLELNDDEIEPLTRQMERMLAFADTIQRAEPGETGFDSISGLENVFRSDEVLPSLAQKDVLANAEIAENGCFLVKKRGETR